MQHCVVMGQASCYQSMAHFEHLNTERVVTEYTTNIKEKPWPVLFTDIP